MKILILGNDGYIGYPLTLHLLKKGHEVFGIDNYSRRERVHALGGESLTNIVSALGRKAYLKMRYSNFLDQIDMTLGDDPSSYIRILLKNSGFEAIVHLAEQPSAPWSMVNTDYAKATQQENVLGTLDLLWAMKEECPDAHLIKIGTMGEYGTPECDIPEGRIPKKCLSSTMVDRYMSGSPPHMSTEYIQAECPMKGLLFPRQPGSFYHLSKVHDTHNIKFCCDNWGLRSTDIMQGILFGVKTTDDEPEEGITRFDYDSFFGTVLNRFCVQALANHPLTVYGLGNQQRGFLPLKDSIQCITIAIENPPSPGEYRTWNQFENIYSINHLANMVCRCCLKLGFQAGIKHIPNPRNELEDHYYNPHCQTLLDLGYEPTTNIEEEITKLLLDLMPYQDNIIERVIMPRTVWK